MGRDSHDWGSLAGGSLVAAGSRHNDSLSTPGRPPSWSDFTARSQRGVSSTFSVGSLALANRRPIVALAVGGVVVRRAANWGDAIELGPLTRGGVHSGKVELFLADGGDPVIISRKELKGLMKSSTGWRTGATARYPLGGSRRGAFLELIPSLGSAAPGSAAALIGMMTPTPSSPDAQSSSSSKDAAKPNVAMAILLALPGSIFVALALPIVLDTPSFHGKMFAVGVGSVLLLTALFPVLAALSGAMGGASKADKERLKRSSMASKVYGITPLRLDGGAHRQSGSSDIDFDPTRRSRAFSGGARSVPDWPHGTMPPAIASKFFDAVSDTSVGELATQLIEACPEADKLYRAYYLKILLSQPYSKAKPAGSEARPVSYCLKKLTKLMKWRGDYGNTAIVASSLRNDYAKYFYFRGFDSTGAPIAWFRASVMPWGDINIDAFVKAVVFQIDSAVRDFMPRGTEGFTCVIDATGIGGSQVFSIARLLKKLADIFVNGFPDRLASLFVTPCTKVIKTIYGMIKGALPASITKKVKLLDDMVRACVHHRVVCVSCVCVQQFVATRLGSPSSLVALSLSSLLSSLFLLFCCVYVCAFVCFCRRPTISWSMQWAASQTSTFSPPRCSQTKRTPLRKTTRSRLNRQSTAKWSCIRRHTGGVTCSMGSSTSLKWLHHRGGVREARQEAVRQEVQLRRPRHSQTRSRLFPRCGTVTVTATTRQRSKTITLYDYNCRILRICCRSTS